MFRLLIATITMSILGIFCTPFLFAYKTPVEKVKPTPVVPAPKPVISGKPIRVVIPSLNIDVQVVDGIYDPKTRAWSLNRDSAQYAANTPLLNDTAGNSFVYGHNNQYVFHDLLNIKPGDEIILHTDNHKQFRYKFRSSFDVGPHQVESVKHDGPPVLTIQTCVGEYFQHRRMFQFDFVDLKDG